MTLTGQIDSAVRDRALILTANQRLSRTLRHAFDASQRARRLTAWESPAIQPLGSWLFSRWAEAMLSGATRAMTLLSPAQERALWQRTIAAAPESERLLDLRGTAKSAMQAWHLLHQYRLPLDDQFSAHEDWAAFRVWALAYRRACDQANWSDHARLPDLVAEAALARAFELPSRLVLAGFDEFTPQQRALLTTLETAGCAYTLLDTEPLEPVAHRRACRDLDHEIRSAAEWSRDLLKRNPAQSIGVVLLDRSERRSRLERIFDEALHPETLREPVPLMKRAFHISMPDPLADFPLVSAALLILSLAGRSRWKLNEAGLLLRSPFLAGAAAEAGARASVDLRLRRWRRLHVNTAALDNEAAPQFARILERWRQLELPVNESRMPSAWAATYRDVLEAAGWPGDRVLSSAEYQVFEAWDELLVTFRALDVVSGPRTYYEALTQLGELAAETQFQPKDPGAPVQILGPLEAAGARFDALWITRATDQTWPAPAHPHPFLPLTRQLELALPHSSPAREHEFAARTFERLQASTADLVVSWAQRDGDVELRFSPLIAALPLEESHDAAEPVREPADLERIADETGPALDDRHPRGGTQLVRLQSACPFQAFADLRLGARPLEGASLGLSAADRGSEIHKALELFWENIVDHAKLTAMTDDDLQRTAAHAVDRALTKFFRDRSHAFENRFAHLEAERLTAVLLECAELEKARSPFRVAYSERERIIPLAGLELTGRIDRLDELPDGRQVIIDYKTTAPSLKAWLGDRPTEPQVPLYAISNDAPVAAVAFAQVGADGVSFRGYAAAGVLPKVKPFQQPPEDQIAEWRAALERIAESFAAGRAEADPVEGAATCNLCRRMALCRIYELAPAEAEAEDEDATA